MFFGFFIAYGSAQVPEKNINTGNELLGKKNNSDSTINRDTTNVVPNQPIGAADTTKTASDSLRRRSDIQTTIKYSARDSINFSIDQKIVKLYGKAHITYGAIDLEADHITIDYTKNTLTAEGRTDSLGNKIGTPIFKNGAEVYETKNITYNFKTGRARISEVVTQQGEGYLHGATVFKNEENELFSLNNTYTTCNLAHPHFRIRAKRTKAIPDDKIVSGPFNLEINDVPTPLGFAFGMFPAKNESTSGIIVPTYGEERRRGFFLRGGGYYFDISDYVKVGIRGDIYSKGGYGLNMAVPYKKRYAYNGNFNFNFTQLRLSDNIEDLDQKQNDFRLAWSHAPETKGTSRFSASVNAATSTYNQNNFLGVGQVQDPNSGRSVFDNTTRKLNSNISFSKTFPNSPFSLGLSARHNQDVRTKQVDILLPSLSFNMSNIYPLRSKTGGSNTWKDKISLRYTLAGTNDLTNNLGRVGSDASQDSIAPFTFDNFGEFLENARRGFRHQIPLNTSFKLLKHFTVSPSINYEEKWYFEKLNWEIDPDNPNNAIIADTIDGFNRVYEYSTSASINTRLYGTYFFKKGSKIEAIRHVMNPNISFSYRPDFSAEKFGYYQRLTAEDGTEIIRSRYQGSIYGGPGQGEQANIGLSLNNTLEMKVRSDEDSVKQSKKVPILNNFGISTGYNVVADSFKLANISLRANTSVFDNKLNINLNGTIDPYVYILDSTGVSSRDEPIFYQRRIDQYAWNNGQGLGQISSATIALSTNLSPKGRQRDQNTRERVINSNLSEAEKDFLLDNPDAYVDFSIPWSLRVNYSLSYRKTGFEDPTITQTLRFSGDFSLSDQWKITYNSGYDFENKDFTLTRFGVTRDLHCWTLNLNWTPFGRYQSYGFTIRVKSSLLQDLKIDRNRSFLDNN